MSVPALNSPGEFPGWRPPEDPSSFNGLTALQRFDRLGELATGVLEPWDTTPLIYGSQIDIGELGVMNVTALYGVANLAVATTAEDPPVRRGKIVSVGVEFFNPMRSNWPNPDVISGSRKTIRLIGSQVSLGKAMEIEVIETEHRPSLTSRRSLTRTFLNTLGECLFAHEVVSYWQEVVDTRGESAIEYLSH